MTATPPETEAATLSPDLPCLYRYSQLPHEDTMLALWWGRMAALGDLPLVFGEHSASLSCFYALFTDNQRKALYYRLDPLGRIAQAALVVPHMTNCAFLTYWLCPAWRIQRIGPIATAATYDILLQSFPVLLGITRQPRLVATHQRWGYRLLGSLPGVFDGYDAWLVSLTRADFDTARAAGFPRPPKE